MKESIIDQINEFGKKTSTLHKIAENNNNEPEQKFSDVMDFLIFVKARNTSEVFSEAVKLLKEKAQATNAGDLKEMFYSYSQLAEQQAGFVKSIEDMANKLKNIVGGELAHYQIAYVYEVDDYLFERDAPKTKQIISALKTMTDSIRATYLILIDDLQMD